MGREHELLFIKREILRGREVSTIFLGDGKGTRETSTRCWAK